MAIFKRFEDIIAWQKSAAKLNMISAEKYEYMVLKSEELSKMLSGLIKTL